MGGTGERELCSSHAAAQAGISPDYNHLLCLNGACMIKVKDSQRADQSSGDRSLHKNERHYNIWWFLQKIFFLNK